ncbi:MAG: DNA polymerase IV [Sedimenticola sp.]|nr:DNA polymerase IV [Sedimenticola sp.]
MPERAAKLILHVDMDAFFASVEQRDRPECRGLPVVIGAFPGKRGVASTCSYEARAYGIRSAMPIAEAYRRCPDALFLKPDMPRYSEASRLVMAALGSISPIVEQVSVDEAYLDITGLDRLFGSPEAIAHQVKVAVWDATALTCSVGVGSNRLIAKLASEHNKPNGTTIVLPDQVADFLDPMPVSNLRGVGPKTVKIVQRLGIRSIKELKAYTLESLQQFFGEKMAGSLYRQSRGLASDQIGERAERVSISKETTFNEDVTDIRLLRSTLRRLCSDVGQSLRREDLKGQVVSIKIRLPGFETHTRQRRLALADDLDSTFFTVAWDLFQASGFMGKPIRLIGIGISDWGDNSGANLDLFAGDSETGQDRRLYHMLDEASDKFGKGALSLGLPDKKAKE